LVLVLSLGGCSSQADSKEGETVVPSPSQNPSGLLSRLPGAANLRFGVYVYRRTLDRYVGRESALALRCAEAGIGEVYLAFSNQRYSANDAEYLKSIRATVASFHEKGIQVHALALDDPKLVFDDAKAVQIVKHVLSYNAGSPENARFTGICADIEPHILKEKNQPVHGSFPIVWSTETYGIGGPNDQLVGKSIRVIDVICKASSGLPVSQAVAATIYRRLKRGELSCGTPTDYLNAGCRFLLLMAYSNQANKVVSHSMPFLQDSPKPNSVMVAVKTSSQTTGDEGPKTTFAGLDRKQFLLKVETILETCTCQPAFRGIAFFEYDGFEAILDK
jgi:hypothetical protein